MGPKAPAGLEKPELTMTFMRNIFFCCHAVRSYLCFGCPGSRSIQRKAAAQKKLDHEYKLAAFAPQALFACV